MISRYLKVALQTLRKPLIAKDNPINLQLEVTTACNSRCQMCNHQETIKKPEHLSFEDFKKIINQVQPLNLNLSGFGESFMNKDLLKMIKDAKQKGIKVNFATNFTLVADKIEKICQSGLDLLKISLDAAERKTYHKIRGIDCFDLVISNIKKMNRFKKKHNFSKPELRLNFALQKDNLDQLEDVIKLARKLEIDTIYVQYMEFVNMEEKKKFIVGDLTFDYLKKKLESANELAKDLQIKTNLPIWLKDLKYYFGKMLSEDQFIDSRRICHFPWYTTYIEYNGDVRPCQMFVWKRNEGIMGNVFKDGFGKVWNNKNYINFRKETRKGIRPFLPCKSCIPQTYRNIFYIYRNLLPGWAVKKANER